MGAECEIKGFASVKTKYLKLKAKELENKRKIEKLEQKEIRNAKQKAELTENLTKKREKQQKTQGKTCNICGNESNNFRVANDRGRICETCFKTTKTGEISDTAKRILGMMKDEKGDDDEESRDAGEDGEMRGRNEGNVQGNAPDQEHRG